MNDKKKILESWNSLV